MTGRERFARAIVVIGEVYNEPLSDVKIEAYWQALSGDFTVEDLETAARRILRDEKFFPRPAEWAEYAAQASKERLERERAARPRLSEDAESLQPPPEEQQHAIRQMISGLKQKMGWA